MDVFEFEAKEEVELGVPSVERVFKMDTHKNLPSATTGGRSKLERFQG
jgi:hypothetical protein